MDFKLALITGATSGIGEALAYFFAHKNINLILTGRNTQKLKILSLQLKQHVDVEICSCDLTTSQKKLIDIIKKRAPDLIINNAGVGLYGSVIEHEPSEQVNILDINTRAVLEITLEASRALIDNGKSGTIMNISSAAAFYSYPNFAIYAASKACVNNFSEALDFELREKGVRVLASCPGKVDTPFSKTASKGVFSASTPFLIMPQEKAVNEIWWQIQKGKTIHVFDWRYNIFRKIAAFIPKPLLLKTLVKFVRSV